MVVPEIRPHRAFIAVALLPLLERLCASLAFGEGSPFLGRAAGAWLAVAPALQLLALGLALLALAIAIRGLFGERDPNSKPGFWTGVALAACFSVSTVHVWYPANARQAAQARAQAAVDTTRDAVHQYAKRHRALPADLASLVPECLPEIPNPQVVGSSLVYRRIPGSDQRFELTVPGPGGSAPLAHYEAKDSLLRRVFRR